MEARRRREGEAGLDGIFKAHAGPFDVGLLETEKLPDMDCLGMIARPPVCEAPRHHQHHHQATISIDRNIALLLLLHFHDHIAHGIPLRELYCLLLSHFSE